MPDRPHLAFPVRLAPGGGLQVNEQDSDEDVASCIAVILSWPRGTRRGSPDFGVPTQNFDEGVHLDEMVEAVRASEPRATQLDPELLDAAISRGVAPVQFGFDQAST